MKKTLILSVCLALWIGLQAQITINRYSTPKVTTKGFSGKTDLNKEIVIPGLNANDVVARWEKENRSLKIAEPVLVNISPLRQGLSEKTGGDIVTRLKIRAQGAISLAVYFDKLRLSKNAELYLYNTEGTVVAGPITANENISDGRLWGSNNFNGNSIILELKVPAGELAENELHISKILYGIARDNIKRSILRDSTNGPGLGNSSSCNKNVVCYTGWDQSSRAVALILDGDGGAYSGSLMMSTCNAARPFVLTAYHCIVPSGTTIDPANSTFEFLWISTTCTTNTNPSSTLLFNGATLRAMWNQTDFALLELFQKPSSSSNLSFLGWSRSTSAPTSSALLSHPYADIMKIALENSTASVGNIGAFTNNAWRVQWDAGTQQQGSSGAPFFDSNKRVVGQCFSNTQPEYSPCNTASGGANHGRFDVSWNGGGTSSTRLKDWLDPSNTNATTTNTTDISSLTSLTSGSYSISGLSQFCTSTNYSIQNLPVGATVQWYVDQYLTSYSTSNNVLTVNRLLDGDMTITAYVTICGVSLPYYKNVHVGGDPISISASPLGCDEVQFTVSGAGTGATYNWSSMLNTVLFNGSTTTASTSNNYITAIVINDQANVSTTNTCSQTVEAGIPYSPFQRAIEGLYPEYGSCGEQVSVQVNTTQYDTYYRWYINNTLVLDGPYATSFCTCNVFHPNIQMGANTIRVEVDASCTSTFSAEGEFYFPCNNYRVRSNVELYPNPAKNQITIGIKQINKQANAGGLQDIREIRIVDKLGNTKRIIKYPPTTQNTTINIAGFPTDIYYVEVSDGKNKVRLPLSVQK